LSNGSPRLNSCFAHHRNRTGALHEQLSTSSALARALARMRIPCLNEPRLVCYRSLQLPHDPSVRRFQARFMHQSGSSYILQRVHPLTDHLRTNSKYIGFPVGGFLQVAVSEAPSQSARELELLRAGAPDTALRLSGSNPRKACNEQKSSTVIQIVVLLQVLAAGCCLERTLQPRSGDCCYQNCLGIQHSSAP
jgi:hypothetical protein